MSEQESRGTVMGSRVKVCGCKVWIMQYEDDEFEVKEYDRCLLHGGIEPVALGPADLTLLQYKLQDIMKQITFIKTLSPYRSKG